MKFRSILSLCVIALAASSLSSCWPVLVGAGAAGGYIARDKGVKVQSPVVDDSPPDHSGDVY